MTHLLLGYPGPVAARVLAEREQSSVPIAVLGQGFDPHGLPEGVRWIDGEPTSIDFGLSGSEYASLVATVTELTLAETASRSIREIESAPLVRKAAEAVEFVRAGGARGGFRFLSSLLVFGDAQGPLSESDFHVGQSFESRGEEALAVAEKVVRSAAHLVPLAIVRAAPIVGDEETREVFEHSALSRLVRRIATGGDDLPYSFSDLPVWIETAGRAARALRLAKPKSGCQTYHLVDAEPLTDRGLLTWLAARFERSITEVSAGSSAWAPRLRFAGGDHRAVRGWGVHFERSNAEAELRVLLDRDQIALLQTFFGTSEEGPGRA